jgi:hypothetical protein
MFILNTFHKDLKAMISNASLSSGVELISNNNGSLSPVELFQGYKHLGIFAGTRSGRNYLVSDIFSHALATAVPVFVLNSSSSDGSFNLKDCTRALEGHCTELLFDGCNLFELPDLKGLDAFSGEEARIYFIDSLKQTLLAMVLGDNTDPALEFHCELILRLALSEFFENRLIQSQYDAASKGGMASEDWLKMPTLRDFIPFCQADSLAIDDKDKDEFTLQSCTLITLRLKFWLDSRIGRAIALPSLAKTDSKIRILSIGNPSKTEEALVLQSIALLCIMRSALASRRSIVFMNEASVLCKSCAFSELLGRLCAQGPKFGIRVILMADDIEPIVNSKAGERIIQNIGTSLIGQIEQHRVPGLVENLELPLKVVRLNALESFYPNTKEGYSNWLISQGGDCASVRHYPSSLWLAFSDGQ